MPISQFLFDIPPLLVTVLKAFVEIMSNPVPDEVIDVFDAFIFAVEEVVDLIDAMFYVDLTGMIDYFYNVYDLLYNAPFAFWILIVFLVCGFVIAIAFFLLDVLDRINFLT